MQIAGTVGHETASELSFGLPPSLGRSSIRQVAFRIADVLSEVGFATVEPAASYGELARWLASGQVDAAWAPPAVCAQVLHAGGSVPLRAVRSGATAYRSALLCATERSVDLKRLGDHGTVAPLRAAWVDPFSAAGCVVPRQHLLERGADLEEIFLGSYRACFEALLAGEADVTATYVGRRGSGYIDLCGTRAAELRVLAWTDEIPNDGVAISPALSDDAAAAVEAALQAAFTGAAERLAPAFDADCFDEPLPGSYAPFGPRCASSSAIAQPRRRPHPRRAPGSVPVAGRRILVG